MSNFWKIYWCKRFDKYDAPRRNATVEYLRVLSPHFELVLQLSGNHLQSFLEILFFIISHFLRSEFFGHPHSSFDFVQDQWEDTFRSVFFLQLVLQFQMVIQLFAKNHHISSGFATFCKQLLFRV